MSLFKKKSISNELPVIKQGIDAYTNPTENGLPYHAVDIPPAIHEKRNFRQQCCSKENLKEQALLIATISSVVIGIGVGIALRGLKCPPGKQRSSLIRYSIWIIFH